jgi:hypothetical protein
MTEQRFTTPKPVRLEVKIPVGDLDVTTIDGDESTVTLQGSEKLVSATTAELVGEARGYIRAADHEVGVGRRPRDGRAHRRCRRQDGERRRPPAARRW